MSEDLTYTAGWNTGAFMSGLRRMEETAEHAAHHIAEHFEEMGKKMKSGLVEALTIYGAKEGLESLFQFSAQIRNSALELGLTTDQVQGLQGALEHYGVSQEQINTGLAHFATKLQEARTSAEAMDKLGEKGISFESVASGDMIAALKEWGEHMRDGADATRDLAEARELLGRGGAASVAFWKLGGDAIDEHMHHVKKASEESIEAAHKMEAAFAENMRGMKVAGIEFVNWYVPKFTEGFNTVKDGFMAMFRGEVVSHQPIEEVAHAAEHHAAHVHAEAAHDATHEAKAINAADDPRVIKAKEEALKHLNLMKYQAQEDEKKWREDLAREDEEFDKAKKKRIEETAKADDKAAIDKKKSLRDYYLEQANLAAQATADSKNNIQAVLAGTYKPPTAREKQIARQMHEIENPQPSKPPLQFGGLGSGDMYQAHSKRYILPGMGKNLKEFQKAQEKEAAAKGDLNTTNAKLETLITKFDQAWVQK